MDVQCDGRDFILYGDFNGFFNPLPSVLRRDPSAGEGSHLNRANITSKVALRLAISKSKGGGRTWKNNRLLLNSLERKTFSGINRQLTVHSYKNCLEKLNDEVKYPLLISGVFKMKGYGNAS